MSCILCELRNENYTVTKIYEDEILSVIMDIQPINPGHILIFPKKCVQLMIDLDDEIQAHMLKIAKKINFAMRKSPIHCEGISYFISDGEAAMQEIPHVHLHLIPRFKDDGFNFQFSEKYFQLPERSELEEIAEMIRSNL